MKVAFVISGIPREFTKYLKPYLDSLSSFIDYDAFLYFPKENCQENYANETIDPDTLINLLNNERYKLILLDTNIPALPDFLSRKQKNSIIQWYRIQKCFSFIDNKYDRIIRIRPDVQLLIDPENFASILKSSNSEMLYIPEGFDLDIPSYNDHIAFGSFEFMNKYSNLYDNLLATTEYKSEQFLFSYLNEKKIPVKRFTLQYKIALSRCKIIAISGDSASGKSTLLKYIECIMPKDSYLTIETDSYHKWERNDENWKHYTHLNPFANNLERMSEDVLRLKIGDNVSLVEYDHATGKFLQEKVNYSKPFVILCGLHTLYKQNILKDLDLKIFLDTEDCLKVDWKVKRDMTERNHTLDKIMETITKRKEDSEKYIKPQKNFADIVITYYIEDSELHADIEMSSLLSSIVHPFHEFFATKFYVIRPSFVCYKLKNTMNSSDIYNKLYSISNTISFLPPTPFQEGITGILQFLIFLVLFYRYE